MTSLGCFLWTLRSNRDASQLRPVSVLKKHVGRRDLRRWNGFGRTPCEGVINVTLTAQIRVNYVLLLALTSVT